MRCAKSKQMFETWTEHVHIRWGGVSLMCALGHLWRMQAARSHPDAVVQVVSCQKAVDWLSQLTRWYRKGMQHVSAVYLFILCPEFPDYFQSITTSRSIRLQWYGLYAKARLWKKVMLQQKLRRQNRSQPLDSEREGWDVVKTKSRVAFLFLVPKMSALVQFHRACQKEGAKCQLGVCTTCISALLLRFTIRLQHMLSTCVFEHVFKHPSINVFFNNCFSWCPWCGMTSSRRTKPFWSCCRLWEDRRWFGHHFEACD